MSLLGTVQWRPHLEPTWCGLVIIAGALWIWLVWRRLLTRVPAAKARWLLLPRIAILGLLLLALLDPVSALQRRERTQGKVLVLLDSSSSMDVADDSRGSRLDRARRIVEGWKSALPGDVSFDEFEFDTQIHTNGGPKIASSVRGTDLGGCLLAISEQPDVSAYRTVVLVTDGGDEPVENVPLPNAPLSVVGVGSDPATWNDVSIVDLQSPSTAEKEVKFEITADLQAHARPGESFAGQLSQVTVRLEHRAGNDWRQVALQTVSLDEKRARVRFSTSDSTLGPQHYRVVVAPLPGELSALNNVREVTVDVQKRSLHVLYFTRELGQSFKTLRNELARDPGIAFTALLRTSGEHFTVQTDRSSSGNDLEAGLPSSLDGLKAYDVVIVGSCPASDCTPEQLQALVQYVNQGGVAVFLGGDKSFGRGGYAQTPWANLFPWTISEHEPEPARGTWNVLVPPASAGHPLTAGIEEAVVQANATVDSLNQVDSLKPGATSLLVARSGARSLPLVAVQPFGKGKVLAVASDTFWRWGTRPEPLRTAYGTFWRQAIRNLTGQTEGGQNLSVKWDREYYRPGEPATGTIHVLGVANTEVLRFSASLTSGNQIVPVVVEPAAGETNAFVINLRFRQRGEDSLRLVAYRSDRVLETYEKTFVVAPLAPEGSRLELDETFLARLAERGGGIFVRERDAGRIVEGLGTGLSDKTVLLESSLAEAGPWFFLTVLVVLLLEWSLRRSMNLI
jgi:uncharacterized membrane protein